MIPSICMTMYDDDDDADDDDDVVLFVSCSTSLPGGSQVDGSPPVSSSHNFRLKLLLFVYLLPLLSTGGILKTKEI